jgi:cyclopropane-fatty-acyl-phospholipid synthase
MGIQILFITFLIVSIIFVIYLNFETICASILNNRLSKIKYGSIIVKDYNNNTIFEYNATNDIVGILYTNNWNKLCKEIIVNGDIGFGKLYIENECMSPNISDVIKIILVNEKYIKPQSGFSLVKYSDEKNIKHHYDVGNDFYLTFLTDNFKAYSCGFFFNKNDTLNDAQYNKVNTIINKLEINENDKILDVGCGWGYIANYIATITKNDVDCCTLSTEQGNFIKNNHTNIRNIYVLNYYDLNNNNKYDKIYSIGMFEHVRYENYDKFFKKTYNLLKNNGRFVLHTITYTASEKNAGTKNKKQLKSFVSEYIFPGGQIPETNWIKNIAFKNDFSLVHMEMYGGQHYAQTLNKWKENLLNNQDKLKDIGYKEEFIRMYEFYFSECQAGFETNNVCITHFVFDKKMTLNNVSNKFHNFC